MTAERYFRLSNAAARRVVRRRNRVEMLTRNDHRYDPQAWRLVQQAQRLYATLATGYVAESRGEHR